ncbi:protein apnoia [Pectinophora gossypiella]|uniref:protein apnoia n=1 Tax=Pectinophora gossypiella TaxID=13191 RepID=UPI00214E8294|nr:protein apnoia [Pectinophora gossypiella]
MCQKFTVLTLAYIAIFVTVVKCEDGASTPNVVDFLTKDMNVGRTFGHNALKRLSFIFLPVMFTLGVISTLLMALAVISVKNLAIGVMLLIVSVSQAVSRLFTTAAAPAPLLLHPRAEFLPAPVAAAPWPAPAPVLSPWARSDNDATID